MAYEFRQANPDDIAVILATVRQENIDEMQLVGDIPIDFALHISFKVSEESYVFVIDGDQVCAFGVVPTDEPGVGRPWMIGTNAIDKHSIPFLRASVAVLGELLNRWRKLRNFADARNKRGLRWLRFMGFTIHPAEEGPGGYTIHRFEKEGL